MLNKKRKGFTLMEIVLVMVLIAILSVGVAIGFTSYLNRGHETGITTDFNSSFKNPIRMGAIEKGKLPKLNKIAETVVADGFAIPTATTTPDWSAVAGTVEIVAVDAMDGTETRVDVEKGNKRYTIESTTYDVATKTEGGTGAAAIKVIADHSSKRSTAIYVLNEAKNDVITVIGTSDDAGVFTVEE